MSKARTFATCLIFALAKAAFASPAVAAPIEVPVGVSDNLGPRIAGILKTNPDVCTKDDVYSSKWLRTSLEFVILCRAIRLGGVEATYRIMSYPNSARTRAELLKGSVLTMVDFPWGAFSNNKTLYKSAAVLKVGEFVKGVYTRPDHTALLKVKTLKGLRKFTAVSSKTWVYDWDALERMQVRKHSVAKYGQMGKMVASGRVDFLVSEFPGASDLSQYINGVRFIPVPGLKVALLGSRHAVVSKRHPNAKPVFAAIQSGLKIMRARGLIKLGYRAVGFFNPRVADWKVLCCSE